MFLKLNHQKLDVYSASMQFVSECYKALKKFPTDEYYNLSRQIKRAVISVHLNIAEGASRKSETERKRFYEIARSSVVEVDAGFDLAGELGFISGSDFPELGKSMIKCFMLLSGLIKNKKSDK